MEARKELDNHRTYTVTNEGKYAEEYNNDDVIELRDKIDEFLADKEV